MESRPPLGSNPLWRAGRIPSTCAATRAATGAATCAAACAAPCAAVDPHQLLPKVRPVIASRPSVVLAAGLRLPQARAGGAFAAENAGHFGAACARELIARTGLDPALFDEVIVGCVGPPHDQTNVARVIGLRAGVPRAVPARTVARNCASGLEAVTSAAASIQAGHGSLYLCLGVEVMSAYPLIYNQRATDFFGRLARARSPSAKAAALATWRPALLSPRIALSEGLTDPVSGLIMGKTAENLVRDFGLTREQCDAYALQSHQRAARAVGRGRFAKEIVPYLPLASSANQAALEADEGIRADQSMEALAKLKPYFEKPDGVVTVGNSCGITDGATALVVAEEGRARELGLTPLARLKGFAWAGCDPARMGLGPVHSTAKLLAQTGCQLADIGAIEINEAFAAQVLACVDAFRSRTFAQKVLGRSEPLGDIDPKMLNPNGGAIALGHPVGASGARLLLTTAIEMAERDVELGLATLCIGGGQGGAALLERCPS